MSNGTDPKTIGIVSYITLIGWIVAIILHSNNDVKSPYASFHLRQSLGIFLTGIALAIVSFMFAFIPILGWLISLCVMLAQIGLVVLWILGLISAANGEEKPIPIVGDFYQKMLKDIR